MLKQLKKLKTKSNGKENGEGRVRPIENTMFQASATSSTRTHSGDASSKAFVVRSPQLTGRVTCDVTVDVPP